ncbi:hypothetical protein TELCIR_20081, partial [Teladorsagia circumcincta]
MDVSGKVSQYAGTMSAALDVVSIIGCALSVVCLALSLFVFTFFREYISSRQRIMNMMKANYHSGSSPNTASTDDKEKQLTPT